MPHTEVAIMGIKISNDNINDFFCANILENQAQWRDKTKTLSKLI